MSVRSVLLQVLLWSGWFLLTVWPEWTGARGRAEEVAARWRDHREDVVSYDRAWLNRHLKLDGRLPNFLPLNPLAGDGNMPEEGCDRQALYPGKAWLVCAVEGWVEPLDSRGAVVRVRSIPLLWPDERHAPEPAPDGRPLSGPLPPQR